MPEPAKTSLNFITMQINDHMITRYLRNNSSLDFFFSNLMIFIQATKIHANRNYIFDEEHIKNGISPSYKCKLSLSTCCWLWLICTWTKVWIKWQNNGYMSYLLTVTPLNICKLLPKRLFQKIFPSIIQINWFFITMIGHAIFHIIFFHVCNNKPDMFGQFYI